MTLRRSLYLSFGRAGGQTLVQFVTNIVLARLLAPAEIGIFVVALAAITIFGALRDFGIPRYLIKERDLTETKLATVFGVAIVAGWSIAGVLYFGRHTAARGYDAPALADIFLVLALSSLIMPIGQPALAMLRREQRHGQLAVTALTAALAGSITAVTFAALGFGPISMAYGALVTTVVTTVLALRFEPAYLRLRPSLREWRSVMGFGTTAVAGELAVQLERNAPALLIGRLMGFAETGLFQRAHSLSHFVLVMIVRSTNWVMGAAMGARFRSGDDLTVLALRTTDYLAVITWPALVLLALKAEAVVYLLYGAAWLPTAAVLPPLCVAAGITVLTSQATAVYEATGAARLHLRNQVLALIMAIALLVIGAQYGLVAVAWLRVPAVAMRVLLHFSVLRRYASIDLWRMLWALRRAVLVTAGFVLGLEGLILLEPVGREYDPLLLFAEAAISGVVYIVLLFVLRHSLRHELLHVTMTLFERLGWER